MNYEPIAHFTGFASRRVEISSQVPWLYIIVAETPRIVYIGETFDSGGLVVRLGSHFGPYQASTLKQRAMAVATVSKINPPFLVVAARLPSGDEASDFDGSSKQVRLTCEAILHERIATAMTGEGQGWAIVSSPSRSYVAPSDQYMETCRNIEEKFLQAFSFLRNFQHSTPLSFIILDQQRSSAVDEDLEIGQVLERIELRLHDWVIGLLKNTYGEGWWTQGVPQNIRVSCAGRQEEEGTRGIVPPEAYLTLIELRTVIEKNWILFRKGMEFASGGKTGKQAATEWLVSVNDLRKVWAHPLKQRYMPLMPGKAHEARQIWARLLSGAGLEEATTQVRGDSASPGQNDAP